jgi:transposase
MLYKLRTGQPWRDLPAYFGDWNSIYCKFNDWSKKDKIRQIFYVLSAESDSEWTFLDASVIRAHQHSSGAAFGQEASIGMSVGGRASKIHHHC